MEKTKEISGIAHIYASYNNTFIQVTDLTGKTISRVTGGSITKQNRLKANPTTSMFAVKKVSETLKEAGITSLYVRIKAKTGNVGVGPGAHTAVKAFAKEGFKIINIADLTKWPRGGPKAKGGRRGRRV